MAQTEMSLAFESRSEEWPHHPGPQEGKRMGQHPMNVGDHDAL